jgi:hypothetical protein
MAQLPHTWSVNNTVTETFDFGDYFKRLPPAGYSPTSRMQRAEDPAAARLMIEHSGGA